MKVGIALGGGGVRGLAHVCILQVLDDLKMRPAVISGTSMGAIVGALYASGMSARESGRLSKDASFSRMTRGGTSLRRGKACLNGFMLSSRTSRVVG